jgi:hypothetical protein
MILTDQIIDIRSFRVGGGKCVIRKGNFAALRSVSATIGIDRSIFGTPADKAAIRSPAKNTVN